MPSSRQLSENSAKRNALANNLRQMRIPTTNIPDGLTIPRTDYQQNALRRTKGKGYPVPDVCFLSQRQVNTCLRWLEKQSTVPSVRKCSQTPRSNGCLVIKHCKELLKEVSLEKKRGDFLPSPERVLQHLRSIYFKKVDLMSLVVRHFGCRIPIEEMRQLMSIRLQVTLPFDVNHAIMTRTAMERTCQCIVNKLQTKSGIIHKNLRLQWGDKVLDYLRVITDYFANKVLSEAQLHRGYMKRLQAMHIVMLTDNNTGGALAVDMGENPLGDHARLRNTKVLNTCKNYRKSGSGSRRRTSTITTGREHLLPCELGMVRKYVTYNNIVTPANYEETTSALNQYLFLKLTNILYKVVTLILHEVRSNLESGIVTKRISVRHLRDVLKQFFGVHQPADGNDERAALVHMSEDTCLDMSLESMIQTWQPNINSQLTRYLNINEHDTVSFQADVYPDNRSGPISRTKQSTSKSSTSKQSTSKSSTNRQSEPTPSTSRQSEPTPSTSRQSEPTPSTSKKNASKPSMSKQSASKPSTSKPVEYVPKKGGHSSSRSQPPASTTKATSTATSKGNANSAKRPLSSTPQVNGSTETSEAKKQKLDKDYSSIVKTLPKAMVLLHRIKEPSWSKLNKALKQDALAATINSDQPNEPLERAAALRNAIQPISDDSTTSSSNSTSLSAYDGSNNSGDPPTAEALMEAFDNEPQTGNPVCSSLQSDLTSFGRYFDNIDTLDDNLSADLENVGDLLTEDTVAVANLENIMQRNES